MAKALNPEDEIVRKNLVRFREESDLSQAEAADLSGIPLDNLRRYENGTTATVPGTVLSALSKVYGHSMDDFVELEPPPAKPEEMDVLFLRTRPGVVIDPKVMAKVRKALAEGNRDAKKK